MSFGRFNMFVISVLASCKDDDIERKRRDTSSLADPAQIGHCVCT